jgi:hypothetical protein
MTGHTTSKTTDDQPGTAGRGGGREARDGLQPLVLDLAVPLSLYYLLHDAFGVGLVLSLALSSVVPAVRTVLSMVTEHRVNALAGLMLAVNVISIALSFITGNPRVMLAKDSGVSSVIGILVLASAFGGRPLMSAGLKPWLVKGDIAKAEAWERLTSGSARFRGLERRFSLVWGVALLGECTLRLIGAFTLPVSTMVWLGTVLTIAGILVGMTVGGAATVPMEKLLVAEVRRAARPDAGSDADPESGAEPDPEPGSGSRPGSDSAPAAA